MNDHIIHTGLYSNEAKHIISAAYHSIGQHFSRKMSKNVSCAQVIIAPDNEICIKIESNSWRSYYTIYNKCGYNQDKILKWLANYMKICVKKELGDDAWSRTNYEPNENFQAYTDPYSIGNKICYGRSAGATVFVPTVAEIYYVYDSLMKRAKIDKKYVTSLVDKIKGQQADPIMAELEANRREEIEKIHAEFKQKLIDCDKQQRQETDDLYKRIAEKYAAKQNDIKHEEAEAIKKVNEMLNVSELLQAS